MSQVPRIAINLKTKDKIKAFLPLLNTSKNSDERNASNTSFLSKNSDERNTNNTSFLSHKNETEPYKSFWNSRHGSGELA